MTHRDDSPVRAWLVLPGHQTVAAQVSVRAYPLARRMTRTAGLAALWTVVSVTTFFITMFDPFLSSIPAIWGVASVWRSWRGHFRVEAFQGSCPRCAQPIALDPGARIAPLHKLVCYNCHHEPHLALG
jgi:hypothetical protein